MIAAGDVAVLVTLSGAAAASITALTAARLNRRKASGKIDTSEAGMLWQQTQQFIAALQEQNARAEARIQAVIDQRDSVLKLFSEQMMPTVEKINSTQTRALSQLGQIMKLLRTEAAEDAPASTGHPAA